MTTQTHWGHSSGMATRNRAVLVSLITTTTLSKGKFTLAWSKSGVTNIKVMCRMDIIVLSSRFIWNQDSGSCHEPVVHVCGQPNTRLLWLGCCILSEFNILRLSNRPSRRTIHSYGLQSPGKWILGIFSDRATQVLGVDISLINQTNCLHLQTAAAKHRSAFLICIS